MTLEKQIQIVKALSTGLQTKQIANNLGVSCRTVEKYMEELKNEYEATTITHLTSIFFRKKFIE